MKVIPSLAAIAAGSLVAISSFADPAVLWVDKEAGNDSTGAKNDETKPYATIQAAVDAAVGGDEIRVKPGVYDTGEKYVAALESRNRVYIYNKRLKIVSTGGSEVTHIVGALDPDSAAGIGADAIRCIAVHNGQGTVIEGFTLRNGATSTTTSSSHPKCGGGAVMSVHIDGSNRYYRPTNTFVVGCVVTNCCGERGAAFRGVMALRCRIEGNSGDNSGCAGRDCGFINCLITGNKKSYPVNYGGPVVNCTIVNNAGAVTGTSTSSPIAIFNSIILGNGGSVEKNIANVSLYNSLTFVPDGAAAGIAESSNSSVTASPYQFVSPLTGKWHVLKGSEAEKRGDASLIAEVAASLPEGVDAYKDLDGNPIPKTGEIAAGCYQEIKDPLEYGGVMFSDGGTVFFEGKRVYGKKLYAFAEMWPTQFTVQAVNKGNPAIYAFNVNGSTKFPTMDDTVYIVPPENGERVYTNSVIAAAKTVYVNPDPEIGFDERTSGMAANTPYRTLKAAIAANNTHNCVVRAAAGDYKSGESYSLGLSNRVVLAYRTRLLGEGAGKSVIWGAPDPATGKTGINATRCICSSSGTSCVQGFTIRDGYTDASSSGDTFNRRGGGVIYNATYANTNLRIIDCVITNCWSYRGGAGYSGAYERCRISDCHGSGGIMRYATMMSCIVDNQNCTSGASGSNNTAYQTTLVGQGNSSYIFSSYNTLTNCILMSAKSFTVSAASGTIVYDVASYPKTGITNVNPLLADVAAGDYRPSIRKLGRKTVGVSPVFGAGEWIDELSCFMLADFDGRPLNLIDGKPAVGAYQWPTTVKFQPVSIIVR